MAKLEIGKNSIGKYDSFSSLDIKQFCHLNFIFLLHFVKKIHIKWQKIFTFESNCKWIILSHFKVGYDRRNGFWILYHYSHISLSFCKYLKSFIAIIEEMALDATSHSKTYPKSNHFPLSYKFGSSEWVKEF